MKLSRLFCLVAGLGLAALLTGCVSDRRTVTRIEPANDFEVVETSAARPLTSGEMGELRRTVARYLDQQGQTNSGDYYLKVYLTPETEGVTPEWVVVRFTRYTETRVAVASDYSLYDPYPSSYYSYDMYPYGYGGFGRISFQYYDDPFYGRRYYYPRRHWRDHDRRDHDRHDHKPGDREPTLEERNRDFGNHRPPGGPPRVPFADAPNAPTPPPENPRRRPPDRIAPTQQRPGIANRPPGVNNPAPQNRPQMQRPPGQDRQWRGRSENGGTASGPRTTPPPRTEARNEPPRSSPPSYRAPDRTPRASSDNSNRSDRREVRDDGKRSGNQQ